MSELLKMNRHSREEVIELLKKFDMEFTGDRKHNNFYDKWIDENLE